MNQYIYTVIAGTGCLMTMLMIARYLFLEDFEWMDSRRGKCILVVLTLLILVAAGMECFADKEGLSEILILLETEGIIFCSRKKHRLRGLLLLFPVLGVAAGACLFPIQFIYLLSDSAAGIMKNTEKAGVVIDIIVWVINLLFIIMGRNWQHQFEYLNSHKTKRKWEKLVFEITGLSLFISVMTVTCIDEITVAGRLMSKSGKNMMMIGTIIINAVLLMVLITMFVQRQQSMYYEYLARLRQYYLNMQTWHFKQMQKSQENTRKMRHDMKNHLSCLQILIKNNNIKEAGKYLEELTSRVWQLDEKLHSGNDIADAVLNAKAAEAREMGITIEVEGVLPMYLNMDPTFLCTLFANALDNALEDLNKSDINKEDKKIEITIKSSHEICMILFKNQTLKKKLDPLVGKGYTDKADKKAHGMGIINMKETLKKAEGELKYHIEEKEGKNYFILEMMFNT